MTSDELRHAIRGQVLLPGDEAFERAAKPWNVSVDQRVAAVVEAADADDVAAVVRHARRAGLTVAAQASGHGASGDVDGVILLRTRRLGRVDVRPDARSVTAEAGVMWGQVQTAAGAHGLTGLAGSAPVVSVVGYTLGGGLSWFSRKHGLAADSVRAFYVVDAEGRQVRVTAESDADLHWALRGGGGDFAVVTAVEFDLFPAARLYGGRVVWPADRAFEVLAAFQQVTAEAPPELSVWVGRVQLPGMPPAIVMNVTYLGDEADGRMLLRRFEKIGDPLADTRGEMSVADLGDVTGEPTEPTPALPRIELLTDLPDEAFLIDPIDPLLTVQLRHLGGRIASSRPDAGACGAIVEPYLLQLVGIAATPQLAGMARSKQDQVVDALGGLVSGRKPYTFLAPGERASAAFDEPTLARLRELKRVRDPHGVFRANYPVAG